MPCCADYAAAVGQYSGTGFPEPDGVSARDFAVRQALPVRAAADASTFAARYVPRPYVLLGLLGLLVCCVGVLALALRNQAQIAAERAEELAATRRLSEEMIALMKEAREAAKPAAAPELGTETTVAVPIGEAAVPQAVPAVASPPLAPAAASAVADVDTTSNSVAPATAATADLAPPVPFVAPAAPPAAVAAEAPAAPVVSPPAARVAAEKTAEQVVVAPPEAVKPLKKTPRTVKAVVPEARAKAAELDRAPASTASLGQVNQPAKPEPSSPKSATVRQELASLPPAVRNPALPARAPIVSPWTKLVRGMTPKQVRSLLGEPRSTEQLMTGEFWFYAEHGILGRGWVAFSDRGVVYEWLTP